MLDTDSLGNLKYLVAIVPPPSTLARLDRVKKEMNARGAQAIPHITLKSAFGWDQPLIDLQRQLSDWVGQLTSFEITLRGIGSFDEYALYLKASPESALRELNTRITELLGLSYGPFDGFNYIPHLTLASIIRRIEFSQLRLRANREFIQPIVFRLEYIGLFKGVPKRYWIPIFVSKIP